MKLQRGVTLIELVITITIAVILVTIAVPSFQSVMRNNRAATSVNTLVTLFAYAKSEAVTRGRRVSVCPVVDMAAPDPICGTDWSSGWLVFVDADEWLVVGDADQRLRVAQPANAVTMTASANYADGVSFSPIGGSVNDSGGANTGTIQLEVDGLSRCIRMDGVGRPRVTDSGC